MSETKKGPTTAELFATVRAAVQIGADNVETTSGKNAMEDATTAIAMLGLRLGAQDTAIRSFLRAWDLGNTLNAVPSIQALRSALTDASPVFTLEEVVQLVHEAYTPWVSRDDVRESVQHHHAAMRR